MAATWQANLAIINTATWVACVMLQILEVTTCCDKSSFPCWLRRSVAKGHTTGRPWPTTCYVPATNKAARTRALGTPADLSCVPSTTDGCLWESCRSDESARRRGSQAFILASHDICRGSGIRQKVYINCITIHTKRLHVTLAGRSETWQLLVSK